MNAITIGEAGKTAGVAPKTIRFYEDKGLLPRPERSPGGYRVYGPADLRRLALIRRARALGFSLSEVRRLLRAADHETCASFEGELAREATRKLAEVDVLIAQLTNARAELSALSERLATPACSDCQAPAMACCDALTGDGVWEPCTGEEVANDETRRLPVP